MQRSASSLERYAIAGRRCGMREILKSFICRERSFSWGIPLGSHSLLLWKESWWYLRRLTLLPAREFRWAIDKIKPSAIQNTCKMFFIVYFWDVYIWRLYTHHHSWLKARKFYHFSYFVITARWNKRNITPPCHCYGDYEGINLFRVDSLRRKTGYWK